MTDVGEFEFRIYDSWDSGIPITDSMIAVTEMGLTVATLFGLVKEVIEEVIR